MKKFLIIVQIFLLFTGCTEKEEGVTKYTINDYRLFVKNNRIIEKNYINKDTIRSTTKYFFSDTQVKVVSYGEDTTIQESYILYNIGENGYAESSIKYPESFYSPYSDTIYIDRKYYTYNSLDQLITVECENDDPFTNILSKIYSYTYDGDNISEFKTYFMCTTQTTYELYDISSKIDILNFTNGILGKTNTKLVKRIVNNYSGDCNPHSPKTVVYDMNYTLDEQGYVIQSSMSTKSESDGRYPTGNTYITLNNYDIRFMN